VEHRIIEGKGRAAAPAVPAAPAASASPTTRRVRIEEDSAGQRLDNFLVKLLKGVPKTHVYRVIRSGEVRVNKGRAGADTRLAIGDEVRVPPVRTAAPSDTAQALTPPREFPIVFEDDSLLALDKPAGVAVHGGSGVSFGVIEQLRRARPEARFLELVHRLDKDTSGLLLLAKKRSALLALQQQLRERAPERSMAKSYSALVVGRWPANLKVIDVALHKYIDTAGERRVRAVDADDADGRRSISLVRIAHSYPDWTLLDVTALLASLAPVTARFFSCVVPTLSLGRLSAANALPPKETNSASTATTIAGDGRRAKARYIEFPPSLTLVGPAVRTSGDGLGRRFR